MFSVRKNSGKPSPKKSKAIIGKVPYERFMAIDPSSTPVKAYTKKQP